jgi:hypothetical protein
VGGSTWNSVFCTAKFAPQMQTITSPAARAQELDGVPDGGSLVC